LIPYSQEPKPFLSHKEIRQKIVENYPDYDVDTIQDHVFIVKKHAFVPYKTKSNTYGLVNWIWNENNWKITSIAENMSNPQLWKIYSSHSYKYYLLWNMNPKSYIEKMKFYLTRERQFYVNEGISKYEPKIEMKFEKKLNENSYGLLELPKNWERVMNDDAFVNSPNQSNSVFFQFNQQPSMMVKWLPLDKNNKKKMPIISNGERSYGNGGNDIDYIQLVDENALVEKIKQK
jgi:hypothetical protein